MQCNHTTRFLVSRFVYAEVQSPRHETDSLLLWSYNQTILTNIQTPCSRKQIVVDIDDACGLFFARISYSCSTNIARIGPA